MYMEIKNFKVTGKYYVFFQTLGKLEFELWELGLH